MLRLTATAALDAPRSDAACCAVLRRPPVSLAELLASQLWDLAAAPPAADLAPPSNGTADSQLLPVKLSPPPPPAAAFPAAAKLGCRLLLRLVPECQLVAAGRVHPQATSSTMQAAADSAGLVRDHQRRSCWCDLLLLDGGVALPPPAPAAAAVAWAFLFFVLVGVRDTGPAAAVPADCWLLLCCLRCLRWEEEEDVWCGSPPTTASDSESVPDRSLLPTSMLCDATRTSCLLCWAGCCMRAAVLCGAAGCLALAACLLAGGGDARRLCGCGGGATRLCGCRGGMLLSRSLLIGSKGACLADAALLVVVLAGQCVLSGCVLPTNGLDPLKCFMVC